MVLRYRNVPAVCILLLLVCMVPIFDFQGPVTAVVRRTTVPLSPLPLGSQGMDPSACMFPTLTRFLVSHPLSPSRHYPHQFNNREGFSFPGCSGPLLEFPILKSGKPFDGSGGPGPDRVVLTCVILTFLRGGSLILHQSCRCFLRLHHPHRGFTWWLQPMYIRTGVYNLINHFRVTMYQHSLVRGWITVRSVFSTVCVINATVNPDSRVDVTWGSSRVLDAIGKAHTLLERLVMPPTTLAAILMLCSASGLMS